MTFTLYGIPCSSSVMGLNNINWVKVHDLGCGNHLESILYPWSMVFSIYIPNFIQSPEKSSIQLTSDVCDALYLQHLRVTSTGKLVSCTRKNVQLTLSCTLSNCSSQKLICGTLKDFFLNELVSLQQIDCVKSPDYHGQHRRSVPSVCVQRVFLQQPSDQ